MDASTMLIKDRRPLYSSVSRRSTDENHEIPSVHPNSEQNGEDIDHRASVDGMWECSAAAEGEEQATWFIWLLVYCCTISGLLFGYDTGVISGVLVMIKGDLGPISLSDVQKELITSATTLGALMGALVAGAMSDWTGRRFVLGLADVVFIGGAFQQVVSYTVWSMIGGRFLVGIGVGLASCVAPIYIQELSPTHLRGRMVVFNNVMVTFGQVVAYAVDAAFANVSSGWRWMVGLSMVPAALQLAVLPFLPESPRILVMHGNTEAAFKVLSRVYSTATSEQVERKFNVLLAAVQQSVEIANTTTFWERLGSMIWVSANRHALIIACGMQAFQQLSGFNTLMYYSASLFEEIGFNQPVAVGLIISGTNCLFTLIALRWIDTVGRRRFMLWTPPGMIFGLTSAAIAFYFMTAHTGHVLVPGEQYSSAWCAIVLLSMIIYVASFASGLGNVPWQQGELFSLEVRGIGTSLATATCWSGNLLISSTYLSLMAAITPSGAFGFYAVICVIGYIFCVCCFPETAGLSLEEVKWVFEDGFGIRRSEELRARKRKMLAGTAGKSRDPV